MTKMEIYIRKYEFTYKGVENNDLWTIIEHNNLLTKLLKIMIHAQII